MAHKDVRTDRIGTNQYYFHSNNPDYQYPSNELKAPNEKTAKRKVLELLGAIKQPNTYWKFCHECSRNRGFRVKTNKGVVTLYHILRTD